MSILATELDWPEGTNFFEVQCRLGLLGPDGEDVDKAPDVKTLGGTVRITPRTPSGRIRILEPDGKYRVVVTTPLTFAINESTGKLVNAADNTEGVWIVDPASDTIDPKGFTYSAVVTPKVGSRFTVEFDGTVAINGVYDLANGAPVAPLRGDSLLESRIAKLELEGGPAGPPGEPGADGRGIESITDDDEDGIATVLYTDGAEGALPLPQGRPGDTGPAPTVSWDGDVLVVEGERSPSLTGDTGPAPSVSWEGTSLVVGDQPPVNLRGPAGARGPVGGPGAVATASDYLIVGPGRPDIPETTGGIITGKEPVGCVYRSTDSAGVGAWVWMKQGAALGWAERWVVTSGDTGVRGINVKAVWPEYSWDAVLKLRRVGETVTVVPANASFADGGDGVTNTGEVSYELNEYGFLPSAIVIAEIYDPYSADFGAKVGVARARSTMSMTTYRSITAFNLRHDALRYMTFELRWSTDNQWPTILPGYPSPS